MNWNYPTTVWFGPDRSQQIQQVCVDDKQQRGVIRITVNTQKTFLWFKTF